MKPLIEMPIEIAGAGDTTERPNEARRTAVGTRPDSSRAAGVLQPLRITSEQLFGAAPEVQIDHRGVVYRLKQTSLGKLILTK